MVLRLFVLFRAGEDVSHESKIGDTCRCGLGWSGLGTASMEVPAGPDDASVVGSVSRRSKREQQTRERGLCRIIGDCRKLPLQWMDIGHLMLRGTWEQTRKRMHNSEERQDHSAL